jgi:starch-binding outer membrane protein, SusD/RagB family
MKKRIYIIICMAVVSALTACNKKLELNPTDLLATTTFYKQKSDFDEALAAVYASLQTEEFSYGMGFRDCLSDDAFNQFNSGAVTTIDQGSLSATIGGYQQTIYDDAYVGIARVNSFLAQLAAYKQADITDAIRKQYTGEVMFVRAFMYYQLYTTYGDVPLVTQPLTLATQKQPKVPAAQILAQIESDLNYGITNLGTQPYISNYGHACASSAQALLARVLIFAAYQGTGTVDPTVMTQVRDLCKAIVPVYSLDPTYINVFRDATQATSKEVIFTINFLSPNNTAPWDLYYGNYDACAPYENMVDDYECTDGLPWGVSPLTDKVNTFNNRDPRLSVTIFKGFVDWGNGNTYLPANPVPTGYGTKKFLEPKNIPYGFSTLSQQDAVILREAEVMLMYAEAENEIAGPDATVYQLTTAIRARVGMPAYPAGLTQDEMRQRIRHERRIELAFEGLRHFDLVRWHTAGQVLNGLNTGLITFNWQDKFYKWPLPQIEIDKSGGILIQNPDYK